jgi:hypothetical protein
MYFSGGINKLQVFFRDRKTSAVHKVSLVNNYTLRNAHTSRLCRLFEAMLVMAVDL